MNMKLGHPVKNKNKVPLKKWTRWSNHAKKVFNDLYHELRHTMQSTVAHPDALPLPKDHWETLRWNAAWLAADAADGVPPLRRPTNAELRAHRKAKKRGVVVAPKSVAKKKGKRVSLATIIKATRNLTLKSVAKKKGKRRAR